MQQQQQQLSFVQHNQVCCALVPLSNLGSLFIKKIWKLIKQNVGQKKKVTYHPDESYLIHVQWIVLNKKVAIEMIEGLRKCANATHRDTPPVLCYFFRISHDQSLATKMKEDVKTIEQHPHYIKAYRMLGMNMDQSTLIAKCEREGISPIPLIQNWPRDEPIAPHADELQFDPVVIDLTELYLDNRSFIDHVGSKDYMDGYSVLMSAHRSLQPYSSVTGTPTVNAWEKILEPVLKARRAHCRLESLSIQLKNETTNTTTITTTDSTIVSTTNSTTCATTTSTSTSSSPGLIDPYVFLEFDISIPLVTQSAEAEVEVDAAVKQYLDKVTSQLDPLFHTVVLNHPQSKYRVMMSCMYDHFKATILENDSLLDFSGVTLVNGLITSICGSVYIFHTSQVNIDEPSIFQLSELLKLRGLTVVLVHSHSVHTEYTGYGLHEKFKLLRQDKSVVCAELA